MRYKHKRHFKFTNLQLTGVILLSAIIVASVIFVVIWYSYSKNTPVIPADMKKHITFQIYVPETNKQLSKIVPDSIKYDTGQGVLSFTVTLQGNNLYFAEQNTPDPIKDIPQYYPALLTKLNEYSEIQTNLGTVALTHPKELNGVQTAVINNRGTLMFIRPESNISDKVWKDFINSLVVE